MSSFALLLCEGKHELEFLCRVAEQTLAWPVERDRPSNLIAGLNKWGDRSSASLGINVRGAFVAHPILAIETGGADKLIHNDGPALLDYLSNSACASYGFLIDADQDGVQSRSQSLASLWQQSGRTSAFPTAAHRLESGPPRVAIFVAPDNTKNGSLDDLILRCTTAAFPARVQAAQDFVDAIERIEPHDFQQYRSKACLGAIGQRFNAGASLATALQKKGWFAADLRTAVPEVDQLCKFLEFLAGL
jgi:hypothetical protein